MHFERLVVTIFYFAVSGNSYPLQLPQFFPSIAPAPGQPTVGAPSASPAVNHMNAYLPRYPMASIALNVGPLKALFTLGSDSTDVTTLNDLKQFAAITRLPPDAKMQLQLITKNLLDAFGLYEPFKKTTKSMILNNPVYHGHQSGMVNYIKKGKNSAEETDANNVKAELQSLAYPGRQ